MRLVFWALALTFTLAAGETVARGDAPPPAAEAPTSAIFAFIVGVNTSVDPAAPPLRYADDDAARYVDLFRTLGARTYVLTRPDDNTRRLHPQVVAEALLPVRRDFERTTAILAEDVAQAKKRGVRTALYFVYAGHGNVEDGHGYISLEDQRLDGALLDAQVVDAIGADQTHFIVDACDSYFLALGRGPGGKRHELSGFSELGGLRKRESVGLLLSTSSARESHEWAGVQAGVFSHEVRSGLYGAADADGDGQVSYREISAFVDRANGAIPNEQYRADAYARPPKDTPVLLDLRGRRAQRIEISGAEAGHYFLEDSTGVRVADFHNDVDQGAYLVRPRSTGRLYLRRLGDDREFVVPAAPGVVALAGLAGGEPRTASRGAANDAFASLFSLPFGRRVVEAFALRPPSEHAVAGRVGSWARRWVVVGGGALAVGTAIVGVATLSSARDLEDHVTPTASQASAAATNDRIRSLNTAGGVELAGAGVVALASAAVFFLWPESSVNLDATASTNGGAVGIHGTF